MELTQNHINTNVLDETTTSLRWVYDSIVSEWNDQLTSLKSLDNEQKKQEVINKAYAVIAHHAYKSNEEILSSCNWWASCLLFALQIVLVEAKSLSGRKCIDGIYGGQTKEAIMLYKKNVLWYSRVSGAINSFFLQWVLNKKPSTPSYKPKPVGPVMPVNPTPVSPPWLVFPPWPEVPKESEQYGDESLDKFLASLEEKYRTQTKEFITALIQSHQWTCDRRVSVLFRVKTLQNWNPAITITTAPWTEVYLKYPMKWITSVSQAQSLFSSICTYLNTEKKSVFYK